MSPETENVFDDAFWEGIDVVVNALDNVNARLYVDSRWAAGGKGGAAGAVCGGVCACFGAACPGVLGGGLPP